MVFDPFDDESDEHESESWDPDPEARFEDPDDDSITIPRIDTEDSDLDVDDDSYTDSITVPAITTDETDAPEDLLEAFWVLVVVLNGALLALSLGGLFLLFEQDLTTAGWLLGIGVVLSGFAARRYKQYQDVTDEAAPVDDSAESDDREGGNETPDSTAADTSETTSTDDSDPA